MELYGKIHSIAENKIYSSAENKFQFMVQKSFFSLAKIVKTAEAVSLCDI